MVLKIIMYIFCLIAFFYIIDLIYNISCFFKEKRNYQFMVNKRETLTNSNSSMLDRIDSTVSILNLTNTLIDNEISKTLESCVSLRTKYDVSRLDKDVKIIATTVFNCIKPEVFASNELLITDTFLMQHITDEVMLKMLKRGQEYNAIIQNI